MKKINARKYGYGTGLTLAALMGLLGPTPHGAFAQNAESENADDSLIFLDEVIVTATRREESIQDVGISVSALTSTDITRQGVEQFFDFATEIPNLAFGFTGDGSLAARSISIRGIGGTGTTGFYIDDTPVISTLDPRILDIERVEVLRGPQGTLFGARSMGGLVRLVTAQPDTGRVEGYAHGNLSFTEEGGANYLVDGAINAPLIKDKLALRVSSYYQYEEGVFDKGIGPLDAPPTSVDKNIDDLTSWGVQAALRFEATENLVLTPRIMYQDLDQDGFRFADLTPGNFLQRQVFDIEEGGTDEWVLASFTAEYNTHWGQFVSTTSYFDRNTFEQEDSSNASLFFLGIGPAPITREIGIDRFVQEVRFASDFEGPFQINSGVFYSESTTSPREYLWTIVGSGAVVGTGDDLAFTFDDRRDTQEFSIFSEVSYDLSDTLQLTAGARYFENETTFEQLQTGIFGNVEIPLDEIKENDINLMFMVEYQPNEDLLLYGRAAEGYRIGGVNIGVPDVCDADLASLNTDRDEVRGFNSDSLWTYEVGGKATVADGRMTVNAAAFRSEWNDLQTQVLLPCGFGFTGNAGAATIEGFEVEIAASVTEGLSLGVNAGYNDARITEVGEGTGQALGDPIFQVPDWTFATNAEYMAPVFGDFDGFFRVDYSYVGQSFSANNNPTDPRVRPSYELLDARFGIISNDIEVIVYAKNLTNEIANLADNRSIGLEVNNLQRIVTNRPRTIGVEVRKRF